MEITTELEQRLRRYVQIGNRFMLLMWRLGLGAYINIAPDILGRIMVLTHIGRKTGGKRRTPVNYAIINGEIYCVSGFGKAADWYRNILKNPNVEVWLPDGWWEGMAEDINYHPNRTDLVRQVLIASAFAARSAGIEPKTMSDEQLADATVNYKLIHIRRTSACTGPGGPGDLAWIWPAATFLLLPLALGRRRRR